MKPNILVGLLTLALIGGVLVFIALIPGCNSFKLQVDFKDIKGLDRGARVYLRGADIGEVRGITMLEDGTVRTTLRIDKKYRVHLKSDADFFIKNDSLILGQKCVYVYVLDENSPPLENGAVIQGVSPWEVYLHRGAKALEDVPDLAQSIAEELKAATPELRQQILPQLLKAKDAMTPLIKRLQDNAPDMLKDFRNVLEVTAQDLKEEWPELSRELLDVANRLKRLMSRIAEDVKVKLSGEK